MQLSIVVPLYNEAESLPELCSWIDSVMKSHSFTYEMIFINDGSKDQSWNVLQELKQTYVGLKAISFARNYGKSAALHEGFQLAEGDVVITMDADLHFT